MSSKRSKTANKKRRKLRFFNLRSKGLLFGLHLFSGEAMRTIGLPLNFPKEDCYFDFYFSTIRSPTEIVAKGTFNDLEHFIERYWKIKVFA